MSTRTIAEIEADIAALKNANPNWLTNADVQALITSMTNQINIKLASSAPAPGPVCFIKPFTSYIFPYLYFILNVI